MAAASAGPYTINLHLAPDREPRQHLITQFFYRPGALPDAQQCQSTEGAWFKYKYLETDRCR